MIKYLMTCLFVCIMLLLQINAIAQEAVQKNEVEEILNYSLNNAPESVAISPTAAERVIELDKQRVPILIGIMTFTFLSLVSVLVFLCLIKHASSEIIFNATGLILVIQAILFMAIASLTTEQLTATIGALSAIAGYLFGRTSSKIGRKEPGETDLATSENS